MVTEGFAKLFIDIQQFLYMYVYNVGLCESQSVRVFSLCMCVHGRFVLEYQCTSMCVPKI